MTWVCCKAEGAKNVFDFDGGVRAVVDFYRKLGFTAEQQRVGMFFYPR